MTSARDPVERDVDQQVPQADDLEDWLTDLRANLDNDPPGWLVPEENADEQVPEPPDWPPHAGDAPKKKHAAPARAAAATASDNDSDNDNDNDNGTPEEPHKPVIGRHRAAQ